MNINLDTAKDTLCKNILIYGYCKYETKGCVFSHNTKPSQTAAGSQQQAGAQGQIQGQGQAQAQAPQTSQPQQLQSQPAHASAPSKSTALKPTVSNGSTSTNGSSAESKRKFNFNTPSFQPSNVSNLTNKFSTLSPRVREIPVFVPSSSSSVPGSTSEGSPTNGNSIRSEADEINSGSKKFNASNTPVFLPSSLYSATNGSGVGLDANVNGSNASLSQQVTGNNNNNNSNSNNASAGTPNPYLSGNNTGIANSSDVYYQPHQTTNYALQYHLYAPAPPPRMTIPLPPYESNVHDMFISNNIRESLKKKNEATMQTLPRSNLPDHINVYHSLVPIDTTYNATSKVWGIGSAVYKVFNNVDGLAYAMRKLELQEEIVNDLPFKNIKKWKKVVNSSVVMLQDCFTSMAFGKSTLIVVYDYYPNSTTLLELHKKGNGALRIEPITEHLMWTYLIQLVNAIISIHAKGLSAGSTLDLTKIISTSKHRIRLSGVGIDDIITYKEHTDEDEESRIERLREAHAQKQAGDIRRLGEVLLELCSLTIAPNLRSSPGLLVLLKTSSTVKFSEDLLSVLRELTGEVTPDLTKLSEKYLTSRMFQAMNELNDSHDYLETQLQNEIENARLFRLLSKLNFIIDRPETKQTATQSDWSENGNKYIIKLFRDYIFFQNDEMGNPNIDLSRVLTNLNKLDAGIEEKILLVSRDEKSCIIVSYKEIRDLIDSIFRGLTR